LRFIHPASNPHQFLTGNTYSGKKRQYSQTALPSPDRGSGIQIEADIGDGQMPRSEKNRHL
jgi:hypothetical protein